MTALRVLDLFSGIGGFSLGLECAGMETIAFCEVDENARKVLYKHWPNIPICTDINNLSYISEGDEPDDWILYDKEDDHELYRGSIDVICGGFPCQDLSVCGLGEGFDGDRSSLYLEQIRLIEESRPCWAVFENVDGLFSREGGTLFARFLSDLAEIGYDAEWHRIPASYVGAWHQRSRIWVIAYPSKEFSKRGLAAPVLGEQRLQIELCRSFEKWPGRQHLPESRLYRDADGISGRTHRLEQLGNAVVPHIPEAIGRAIVKVHQEKERLNR